MKKINGFVILLHRSTRIGGKHKTNTGKRLQGVFAEIRKVCILN